VQHISSRQHHSHDLTNVENYLAAVYNYGAVEFEVEFFLRDIRIDFQSTKFCP
jgi:hypothetical protein